MVTSHNDTKNSSAQNGLTWSPVGGDGGVEFRKEASSLLRRLCVWTTRYRGQWLVDEHRCITRMEFWFADDDDDAVYAIGEKGHDSESQTIDFAAGEYLTSLELWEGSPALDSVSADAKFLTKVKFCTSSNYEFEVGTAEHSTRYEVPVASGLIIGVTGKHSEVVDRFAFLFLDNVESVTMEIDGDALPTPTISTKLEERLLVNKTDEVEVYDLQYEWVKFTSKLLCVTKGNVLRKGWNVNVSVRYKVDTPAEKLEADNKAAYNGFVLPSEDIITGTETDTSTEKTRKLSVAVSPHSRCHFRHRHGTISLSATCHGLWSIRTTSGERRVPFEGLLRTTKTLREFSHEEEPMPST